MRAFIHLIVLILLALSLPVGTAWARAFQGIPHEIIAVRASDGTELSLYHLRGNESGPVILLEPGLVETAEMLDGIAAAFHAKGFEVYIGQVRLAGRGEGRSGGGAYNGLEEVALVDFPAHLRDVISRSNGRAIHLLGHSMGGIEILAAFSDARLAAEFAPHVKAVTLMAAPHEMSKLPWIVRSQSKLLLPVFKTARRLLGKSALSPHHSLFDFTLKLKNSPNPVARGFARTLELGFIRVGSFILNKTLISMNHTTPEAMRRLWFKEVSALPLDLLIDFAEGAAKGEFVKRDGSRLITPERITIPVQVMRAENDMLVPWAQQESLFGSLASKIKRLVSLKGMLHVDMVVADRPSANFLVAATDFHQNPERAAREAPHLVFTPNDKSGCAGLLTLATP